MPLSHLCHSCGMELCRRRVAPDPHYGLPVVVCARCGAASVRRRHPLAAWRRGASRLLGSGRVLAGQVFLALLFTLVFSAFLHALRVDLGRLWPRVEEWRSARDDGSYGVLRREFFQSDTPAMLFGWAVFAAGIGAWLVAGFPHWRRWLAFSAWIGAMFVVIGVEAGIDFGMTHVERFVHPSQSTSDFEPSSYCVTALLAAATVPLAVPGAVAGVILSVAGRAMRRGGWRRRLARLRRRRHA